MGSRVRARAVAALAIALVVLLAACAPSPRIPRLEELPPQTEEDAGGAPVGITETIAGRVVGQRYEHGEPEDAGGGRQVVPQSVVVTIARSDREAEIELLVFTGYVAYPPPDTGEPALDLPEGEYTFVVRQRPDGRYECASPACVLES